MKNIFSTDVTNGDEQTKINGACFLTNTVSPTLQQQLDSLLLPAAADYVGQPPHRQLR